jgi:hypothetical protein
MPHSDIRELDPQPVELRFSPPDGCSKALICAHDPEAGASFGEAEEIPLPGHV